MDTLANNNIIQPAIHNYCIHRIGVIEHRIIFYILKQFQVHYRDQELNENFIVPNQFKAVIQWNELTRYISKYTIYKDALLGLMLQNILQVEEEEIHTPQRITRKIKIRSISLFDCSEYQEIEEKTDEKYKHGMSINLSQKGIEYFSDFTKGFLYIDYSILRTFRKVSTIKLYQILTGFIERKSFEFYFQKLKIRLLKEYQELDNTEDTVYSKGKLRVKQYSCVHNFISRVLEPAIEELKEKGDYYVEFKKTYNKDLKDWHFQFFIKINPKFREYHFKKKYNITPDINIIMNRSLLKRLLISTGISVKEIKAEKHIQNILMYLNNHSQEHLCNFLIETFQRASVDFNISNPKGYMFSALEKSLNVPKSNVGNLQNGLQTILSKYN